MTGLALLGINVIVVSWNSERHPAGTNSESSGCRLHHKDDCFEYKI